MTDMNDEKLRKDAAPHDDFDPFGLRMPRMFSTLGGIRVVESPDRPRYTLPAEVLPGVPWPLGFREDFNRWSRLFLGATNVLPPGMAYIIGGHTAVMRPADVVKLTGLV